MRRVVLVAMLLLVPAITGAQIAVDDAAVPRTPWGHPDLQGIWDYRSTTPFERPEELGDTAVVTGEAATSFLQLLNQNYRERQAGVLGADWSDHFDNGLAEGGRTSLIVDPPNGRLPPFTSGTEERRAARVLRFLAPGGPEDRLLTERCMLYKSAPLGWSGDNNHIQIFQTEDSVALVHEMIHEVVIIPLDGRPHLPPHIRLWQGDARGSWDGDTLVVETTNRHAQWAARNGVVPTPSMRVVERFRRIDEDTLHYEFTVDDPETYTRPYTAAWPMRRTEGPIYEYACHEGNRSMELTLTGERALEAADR